MTKRYCDRCGQQIDEGVHAWYVLELHGTDGEFRHKELCEECYELLAEDNYIPRIEQTEPQTDCGDFADRLAYERGVKHAWEVAQKVFNSTVTFYEAEAVAKQIDKDINVRSKDEPQTDCAWSKCDD